MKEKEAQEKLKQGWIHLLVTFEIIGKPKEHVEKALKDFLDVVKKEERIGWLKEHIEPAIKTENDFFSSFAEVDLLVKDFDTAAWLAINFTPSTIEVIEPSEFHMPALQVQNWMNDMLSRLHQVGAAFKQQTSYLEYLKENFRELVRNSILLSLSRGPKNLKQLSHETTMVEAALKEHLDKLVKEKKVIHKKGVYSLK